MDSFLDKCIDMIKYHDNNELYVYIKKNTEAVSDMIRLSKYTSLYETACESKNYECVQILIDSGMGPDNMGNYEQYELYSPLRMSFSNMDINMIEVLTKAGFKSGIQTSCNHCIGCDETTKNCLFYTLFSGDKFNNITDEILSRIIRVSDWTQIISAYERTLNARSNEREMNTNTISNTLDNSRMDQLIRVICKIIPVFTVNHIRISDDNVDHVMCLASKGLIYIDKLMVIIIMDLLGIRYKSCEMLDIRKAGECLRTLVDYGVDTTEPFFGEFIYYKTGLPTKKGKYGSSGPHGSMEDVVKGVIYNRGHTLMMGHRYSNMYGVDSVIDEITKVHEHIKCKNRRLYRRMFIGRRIKRFKEDEYPDIVCRNLVDMDITMFSNVMKYIA